MNKLEHILFLIVIYVLFVISCTIIWYTALRFFLPALPFRIPLSVSNSVLTIFIAFPPKSTLKKMQESDDDD
ncbi:hypothetical protein [Paenibacillus radicis (ex Xue et al. 2023)]|uniref:Uncharacterized protein n=1 Tax=Paenibacillus radicis (ex Xue et al. 2023) TaxID=2972489 RepID=A0ABT1YEU9_9BACL|nr:hypothetical protein [Paenibacillus radicis (ex Xue et al. 2023)]MCR8630748.1 hypothetical protein [Paenibacillus radicis (ex Xue et al. 2023)]